MKAQKTPETPEPSPETLETGEVEAWEAYCQIFNTGRGPQGEIQRHAFKFAWMNAQANSAIAEPKGFSGKAVYDLNGTYVGIVFRENDAWVALNTSDDEVYRGTYLMAVLTLQGRAKNA